MMKIISALCFLVSALSMTIFAESILAQSQYSNDSGNMIQECDRQCLEGHIDNYLVALAARDSSPLNLTPDARFTENGSPLELNDGLWATITDIGTYRTIFTGEAEGAAVVFALIEENGIPAFLTVRLKVETNRLAEIETWVTREGGSSLYNPVATNINEFWKATVAENERSSPEKLRAIVASYFDGIENNSGDNIPFGEGVYRFENGVAINNPVPGQRIITGPEGSLDVGVLSMKEQFNLATNVTMDTVRPRRYEIVDQERGLVVGFYRFNVPGKYLSAYVPGVGDVLTGDHNKSPRSVMVAEAFKIVDGKII